MDAWEIIQAVAGGSPGAVAVWMLWTHHRVERLERWRDQLEARQ